VAGGVRALEARSRGVFGELARAIGHVGSMSIPAMPAKDCIDVQVRVDDVANGPDRGRDVGHRIPAAAEVPDLAAYGQVKQPATVILMEAATRWAVATR
jgi:GrpB-like predicted nucleotidyltransferase (UPF0157 family)